MITDILISFIDIIDKIYTSLLATPFQNLLNLINTYQQYTATFQQYSKAVMFLFGKPLFTFMVTAFVTVLTIRLIFAIVKLIMNIT